MKKLLIALGVFFGLLVVAVFVLPAVISLDSLEGKIESAIDQSITGKSDINGIRLSTFPWLGVKVASLQIKNGAALRESDFLSVQEAGFQVKVLPLLRGEIVGEIRIHRPVIRLEKLPDGRDSLALLLRETGKKEEKSKPTSSGKADEWIERAQIKSLSITDGEIRKLSQTASGQSTTDLAISKLDLTIENLALKGEIPLRFAAAVFNANKQDVKMETVLVTDLDPQAGNHAVRLKTATLSLGETIARLTGSITQRKDTKTIVNLDIDMSGISLGRLDQDLPLLKGKMPEGLEGDMDLKLKVEGPSDAPKIDCQLASNRMKFGVNPPLHLEATKLVATMMGENVTLASFSTKTFGGALEARGTASMKGPVANLEVDGKSFDLNTLMTTFGQKENIAEGKIDLQTTLFMDMSKSTKSPAGSPKEAGLVPAWMQSKGRLTIGPGRVLSLNLLGDTAKALVQVSPLAADTKKSFESVNWKKLQADFSSKDGKLFLDPLMMSYPSADVDAKGEISETGKLDLRGMIHLEKETSQSLGGNFVYLTGSDGKLHLPFRVTGTMEKPITYIDMVTLVKKSAVETAKKVVPPEVKTLFNDLKKNPLGLLQPPSSPAQAPAQAQGQ